MSDDLTVAYQLGVEDMRSKLHKQADEIERLRERLAEADEANRRVSDENEKLRENNDYLRSEKERLGKDVYNLIVKKDEACAEIETLRRDVKTAVMGDSAELQDAKREIETLICLLCEAHVKMVENDLWVNLRQRVAAALKETGDE